MNLFSILLLFIFSFPFLVYGSNNAGAFIENGIQARASGMGMSHVSIAQNSDAIYWNPALLSFSTSPEVRFMGAKAYETHYVSMQGLFTIMGHPIGVGIINAYMDDIKETTYDATTSRYRVSGNTLFYNATASYLASSFHILDSLSIGTSLKYLQERVDHYQTFGIGLDVGMAYILGEHITLGANVQNLIQPSMKRSLSSATIDTVPTLFKLGGSASFFYDRLLTSMDLNLRKNRTAKITMGLEYWLTKPFAIRVGLNKDIMSLGLGLHLDSLMIDFAWNKPAAFYLEDIYKISFAYQL